LFGRGRLLVLWLWPVAVAGGLWLWLFVYQVAVLFVVTWECLASTLGSPHTQRAKTHSRNHT